MNLVRLILSNSGMLLAMTPTDLTELFGLNEDDVDVIFMAKEQIELGMIFKCDFDVLLR